MAFLPSSSLLISALTVILAFTPFSQVLSHPAPQDAAVRTVYQFPNLTSLENIAVRSNGQLLVAVISSAELYQVDPFNNKGASLVHRFPGALSTLGIAEVEPDIFAIIVANYTPGVPTVNGSGSIWRVDLRSFKCSDNGDVTSQPTVTKIASIPESLLPNGLALLAPGSPYILVADSGLGAVWRVNFHTGEYVKTLSHPLMLPSPEVDLKIGINGVHIFRSTLYFTNTVLDGGFFAKVPIHLFGPNAGTAAGDYVVVSKNGFGDDFVMDKNGNAYIAQNVKSGVQLVTPDGKFSVIAGNENSTALAGDAALQFGRTTRDKNVLYVVTSGNSGILLPGLPEGGKVVAIDIARL
ncbi:uncharacterized protein BP5553_09788 [Venustampulla echinocandica]|uniref:NHL repeat-containing protein n=1 Tax=Venustampulla echinocandica TaxID=2656787 RepID=A0A370TAP8_9HELO|nr:uncharacterized protein BP5553_09788 [Venustampulla echinocandica]RDL30999.1 hypothetical protein BP5553_09788 [Venustampulla echinocandica]